MKRISVITFALAIAVLISGVAHSVDRWDNTITVSPNVLVPGYINDRLTVHTNIMASDVVKSSLYLEVDGQGRIEPLLTYTDSTGHIAAKFDFETVYSYAVPPCAVIVMYGTFTNGEDFSGEDIVDVK
ncbi:MAG: hypothetical protein JW746_08625 [Candidatus Krumholzibacteriota bacterium]|nr:hypothetical protein [Candidatus Krumholzibacteriota bacterium]